MTGKRVCKTLPEHLVERIIALLPFPSIFQARCLTKSWNAKFSPIATQPSAKKRRVAMSFQKLMGESCRNWKTFCPVLISSSGDFVAYDKETGKWKKMPSLSFLPDEVLQRCDDVQIEGALLYATRSPPACLEGVPPACLESVFYVANVLNRTWKRLPPPPTIFCVILSSKLVVTDRCSDTYKLILFCGRTLYQADFHFVQIYHSKSESWSIEKTADTDDRFGSIINSVYLKGCLHTVSCYNPPILWTFSIENGTMEQRNLNASRWNNSVVFSTYCALVVCKDNLFMVTGSDKKPYYERVLKIDVEAWGLRKMSEFPTHPAARTEASLSIDPFGDDCHIFFGSKDEFGRFIIFAYNVVDDLWSCAFAPPVARFKSCYKWIASFRPSLSPFLEV